MQSKWVVYRTDETTVSTFTETFVSEFLENLEEMFPHQLQSSVPNWNLFYYIINVSNLLIKCAYNQIYKPAYSIIVMCCVRNLAQEVF